jgi:hypothetical protein
MRSSILGVVVVTIIGVLLAQGQPKKNNDEVPKILLTSRYVYVEAIDGDVLNPRVLPENRKAITDLQYALQDWKRYIITAKRREAEIVFVVSKGSLASVKGGVGTQGGTNERTEQMQAWMLKCGYWTTVWKFTYSIPTSPLMGPIWRHSLKDGLDPPRNTIEPQSGRNYARIALSQIKGRRPLRATLRVNSLITVVGTLRHPRFFLSQHRD